MFVSTAGKTPPIGHVTIDVLRGVAPDGGLWVPVGLKPLPMAVLRNLPGMTLQEVAYLVLNAYLGELYTASQLKEAVSGAFSFPIPLVDLDRAERGPGTVYALETFHGPTRCFKDLGTRLMASLKQLSRSTGCELSSSAPMTVLAASTGSSALAVAHAFASLPGTQTVVLLPRERLTAALARSLASLGSRVKAVGVRGTINDCQEMVSTALSDPELHTALPGLVGANSVNLVLLLAQTVAYFWAYAQLALMEYGGDIDKIPQGVDFAVPCGNLGNLTSALLAQSMGLKSLEPLAAMNANAALSHWASEGCPEPFSQPSHLFSTMAPSLDVASPTNLPRLSLLARNMGMTPEELVRRMRPTTVDNDGICRAIRRAYSRHGYVLAPAAAVAYGALTQRGIGRTAVVMATSDPADEPQTMSRVLPEWICPMPTPEDARSSLQGLFPTFPALKRYLLHNS